MARLARLTSDGSPKIINGTSDWVNEEEFYLRDGFEWSPDGRNIAYLQFDQSDVPEFALINYTDTLYPVITKYHYPKPGQTNSAVRVGVVSASGRPHALDEGARRSAQYLHCPHGLGRRATGHLAANEPPPKHQQHLARATPKPATSA